MSKLKAIIALEERMHEELKQAKESAELLIDEKRKEAEKEIASFRLELDKEILKLKTKETKEVKALEDKLASDKLELNKKFEERFEQIVTKYVKTLKDEVTNI